MFGNYFNTYIIETGDESFSLKFNNVIFIECVTINYNFKFAINGDRFKIITNIIKQIWTRRKSRIQLTYNYKR
ncbi:hypothetical protein C1149_00155 [Clostridium botulinum]|nr:hypothetical protein C1149_00155 [Clostridium botulinum]